MKKLANIKMRSVNTFRGENWHDEPPQLRSSAITYCRDSCTATSAGRRWVPGFRSLLYWEMALWKYSCFFSAALAALKHKTCRESSEKCPGCRERGQGRDAYLSALLDPGVARAWKQGETHTVTFSADWMMDHSLVLSWRMAAAK